MTSFQNSLPQALNNPPVEDDPDKQFLISFLPSIRLFTEYQKMEFKFKFHQLFRNFTNSIKDVFQTNQIHKNFSNSTNNPNIPYQMQQQHFFQNTPVKLQHSTSQQENYGSPTFQPSSSTYINQRPYPHPLNMSTFTSIPCQQLYQPSAFISTAHDQLTSYSSAPITQQDHFCDNDDTVDSI